MSDPETKGGDTSGENKESDTVEASNNKKLGGAFKRLPMKFPTIARNSIAEETPERPPVQSAIQRGETPSPEPMLPTTEEETEDMESSREPEGSTSYFPGAEHKQDEREMALTLSGALISDVSLAPDTETRGSKSRHLSIHEEPSRPLDRREMYQAAGRAYGGDRSERYHSLVNLSRRGTEARRSIVINQTPSGTRKISLGYYAERDSSVSDRPNVFVPSKEKVWDVNDVAHAWDAYMNNRVEQADATSAPDGKPDFGKIQGCQPPMCIYYPHFVFVRFNRMMGRHKHVFGKICKVIYLVYVTYAIIWNAIVKHLPFETCDGWGLLCWTTATMLFYTICSFLYKKGANSPATRSCLIGTFKPLHDILKLWFIRLTLFLTILISIAIWTHKNDNSTAHGHLIAIAGYMIVLLLAYLCSKNPQRIRWEAVMKNLILQFIVVFLFKLEVVRALLDCFFDKIGSFMSYSLVASEMVFSKSVHDMLALELLCSLVLTGCYMHILYYTGLLQSFLHKLGFILEHITSTTAIETICGALCTLVGGIEASVVLEPYIILLTRSELHTFIVSGIACMTGNTISIYIAEGVSAVDLLRANFATYNGVMALSKIIYPEKEISVTTSHDLKFLDTEEYGIVDAGVSGACATLRLLAGVIAALISMISVVSMINDLFGWLLRQIGIHGIDLVKLVSILLQPLIFLLGVEWQYSSTISDLFAIKTIKNEMFAYERMLEMEHCGEGLPPREQSVTTSLLYGFSNLPHMGVTVAFMVALAPERRLDISRLVPRATLTGILVNLLTASLIGILDVTDSPHNVTLSHAASSKYDCNGTANTLAHGVTERMRSIL